jgi:ABC-type antimicrobial peptide transport system permease subunit
MNKLRCGLTILGVVIGITSIVGMTVMIRGFDQSLREMAAAGRRSRSASSTVS